ncbi:MAG: acyl-CoA dehydrogenase [Gammaproteobacteria bacterium]|nr:acyl-CoA dehydrogenase [Gammaproteobacteria bacterium]
MTDLDKLDLLDVSSMLNEDEVLVRDTVARFVDEQVAPIISDCFATSRFPAELVPELAKLGLLGANIEGHGCAGLNDVSYGLICQELERGDSGLRSFISVQTSLVMYPIMAYGSDAQQAKWLPELAQGEAIGCFGLTEPHGGSDPANMKTHAKRDGSDWRLSGSKIWITNGSIADVALVWAQTEDGVRGFIVETDAPGFATHEIQNKFSLRASVTSELFLDDVRVPEEAMLPGALGMRGPLSCLSQARFGIAWGAVGAAQACLAEALGFAETRELFGRSIAATQSVQIKLADMARQLGTAQLLALHLGRRKEKGQLHPTQISLGKWNNVRMALDVARGCRELLGASGITIEFEAIRHMLNLETVVTYEGTETVHQLVVGKELTGVNAF